MCDLGQFFTDADLCLPACVVDKKSPVLAKCGYNFGTYSEPCLPGNYFIAVDKCFAECEETLTLFVFCMYMDSNGNAVQCPYGSAFSSIHKCLALCMPSAVPLENTCAFNDNGKVGVCIKGDFFKSGTLCSNSVVDPLPNCSNKTSGVIGGKGCVY